MLDESTDEDRGFNSAAIAIADTLGAPLALSVSGVVFGTAGRLGLDPFVSVLALAVATGVLGVAAAARTAATTPARRYDVTRSP
jgi:hypothetical protein